MEYSTTHDSVNGRTPKAYDPPAGAVPSSAPAVVTATSLPAEGDASVVKSSVSSEPPGSITAIHQQDDGYKPLIVTDEKTGQEAVYPPLCRDNEKRDKNPTVINDPILGRLERPLLVPTDLDRRVDCGSVWIKLVPVTNEVVYFMPGACTECLRLQQHCDRSSPTCGRCQKRGATCVLGPLKHLRPAPPLPIEPARRYTTKEKGKGRADSDDSADEHGNGADDGTDVVIVDEGGRGKRVKKKRRLSASDEVDPNLLNFDGTGLKKARARPSRPVTLLLPPTTGPLRPEDVPSTEADLRYDRLCKANAERPPLKDLVGLPPFWADRRRALQAASPYFRDPIRTTGASVDVGPSGIARGVILEGIPVPTVGKDYFGEGKRAGSIHATIGQRRRKQQPGAAPPTSPPAVSIADDFQRALNGGDVQTPDGEGVNGSGPVADGPQTTLSEEPVVEALILAQRAQTPVAVALSPTYAIAPFHVPKAVLGLGWFWIIDAWTERVDTGEPNADQDVAWKFRFEWCEGDQGQPWWQAKDADKRAVHERILDGLENPKPAVSVRGPGISGPTTCRGGASQEAPGLPKNGAVVHCRTCDRWSVQVYATWAACLNEQCADFSTDKGSDGTLPPLLPGKAAEPLFDVEAHTRLILPESFKLGLAPPSVIDGDANDIKRHDAQRDMWRAWVCSRCRMANERRDWFGVLCEWCQRLDFPKRNVYSAAALRPPSRPVCTGQRQDDGMATWAFAATQTSTTFADEIKAVRHGVDAGFGAGAEVSHVLSHDGAVQQAADTILKGLQIQGPDEVRLRRFMLPATSSRPSELSLSPFYTFLAGPNPVPFITHFPTGKSVKWEHAPQVMRDAADLLNERCGRIYTGQTEYAHGTGIADGRFNSLLVAAMPPVSPATVHPIIPVEARTTIALLVLGADMTLRFKYGGKNRVRAGDLVAQHGDVVLVKAGSQGMEGIDVEVRSDGFGFVCVGRRAYAKNGSPAGLPEAPTQPPSGPLGNWYIGAWPLDVAQPLRPQPPSRTDVPEGDDEVDTASFLASPRFRGIEVTPPADAPTLLEAPALPPLPRIGEKPKRGRASMAAEDDSDAEASSTPGRGRGRGRGRGSGTPRGRGARVASGTGRGRGRGGAARGRGRGGARGRGRASGSGTRSASAVEGEGEGSEAVEVVEAVDVEEVGDAGDGDIEVEADESGLGPQAAELA